MAAVDGIIKAQRLGEFVEFLGSITDCFLVRRGNESKGWRPDDLQAAFSRAARCAKKDGKAAAREALIKLLSVFRVFSKIDTRKVIRMFVKQPRT